MSFTINIVNDSNGTTVRSYTISDAKVKVLKDSIPGDQAVLDWMENAIKSYITKRSEIMRLKWLQIYAEEGTMIPQDEEDFINDIASRPDYLDQEARDANAPPPEM